MSKFGYIRKFDTYADEEKDKVFMQDFGCVVLYEDQKVSDKICPEWDRLISKLNNSDTLVISKLSHIVSSTSKLSFFLQFCLVKRIRLVSINDHIDSAGELFPDTTVTDILRMFAMLPKEVNYIRRHSQAQKKINTQINVLTPVAHTQVEKELLVVNMYKGGHRLKDIMKATGYASRDSVYRILEKSGIKSNRKKSGKKCKNGVSLTIITL